MRGNTLICERIRPMGKNVIKAALLGAGTVGSGVYALSGMLADEMMQKTGGILEIKKVMVRDLNKNRERLGFGAFFLFRSIFFHLADANCFFNDFSFLRIFVFQ